MIKRFFSITAAIIFVGGMLFSESRENIEDPFGTEDAATQPDVQIDAQPDAASDDFSVDDNSINLFAEEGSALE